MNERRYDLIWDTINDAMAINPFEPQPKFTELAVPTQITFRAATPTKSVYISAYCNAPEQVVSIIQRMVQQAGGMSVCQPIESEGFCQRLLIGAQLPGISSSDLWKIRAAVQTGGIVETVRVNYQIRRPDSTPAQPSSCIGCRYYYGKRHGHDQLICAMHPYGPSDDLCRDWEAAG